MNPAPSPLGPSAPVVGVIGAGQLARMMQPAAIALGLRLRVLSADPQDCANQVIPDVATGHPSDLDAVLAFARGCDVITFEHEHVPADVLDALVATGIPVRPGPGALLYAQDKAEMRAKLSELGLPCPAWTRVTGVADVERLAREIASRPTRAHGAGDGAGALGTADAAGADAAATTAKGAASEGESGWPIVLKATRGGYDGRGVWVVEDADSAARVIAESAERGVALLAEAAVPFVRELSAQVARSPHGQAVAYPVVETVQREGICREVYAPAPGVREEHALEAQRIALTIAKELDVTGMLAVELFQTADGRLWINELAMRPHNSGHWSIDGSVTSQFENHLRAVLDLPLGSPAPHAPLAVMANVIGLDLPDLYPAYLHCLARDPGLKIHTYGKAVKPGRKIGHVNVLGEDFDDCVERARHAAAYLRGEIDE